MTSPSSPTSRDSSLLEHFQARPKAELHVHLEGTLSRARYRQWASEDGEDPDGGGPSRRYGGFHDFLHRYAEGCRRLARRPERLEVLVSDFARRARRDGITLAELTFSPAIFDRLGVPWDELAPILDSALDRASGRGLELRVILDSVRQWGRAAAERVLDLHEERPLARAVAFGVAGDETQVATRDFATIYDRARSLGLFTTVHAGEARGADSIAEALDLLGPDRIAHGIAAIDDPALLQRLVESRTPLDTAPTSNVRTGVVPRFSEHPLPGLLAAGVAVTISTDDPSYFSCSLSGEAARLVTRLGLSVVAVDGILDRSFEVAFHRAPDDSPGLR